MTQEAGGLRAVRLLLFFLIFPAVCAAAPRDVALARSRELRLADDAQWLRFGHWKKSFWRGAWSSDAARGFFLSTAAVHSPREELDSEIAALYSLDRTGAKHVLCRFPARTAWITRRLDLNPAEFSAADCSEFDAWRTLMDAGSVSLIFASSYMDNPSSMFGHTFLRLERRATGGDPLRDNTLNFAADTGDDSGPLFAVKGLLGLYPGTYTVMPYYMKIAEYNDVENRDLWEYRLALSTAEVERLVAHAWEMGAAQFPYYFFSKNCSYQLLPALEAAAPRLLLMAGSPAIVGPADTVHAVESVPGLAAHPVYRPSHATAMLQVLRLLDRRERRAADAYARGEAEEGDRLTRDMAADRRALILDAAADRILYRSGFSPDVPTEVREQERPILVRRSKLDEPPFDPPTPAWAAPPTAGHLRHRLTVGAGSSRDRAFTEVSWRPGYHDLLDPPRGYLPGAEISGLSARLRYDRRDRHVYVLDARLVDILSAAPWDSWTRKPSWSVGTGLETAFELTRPPWRSSVYEGHVGTGFSADFWQKMILYSLIQAEGVVGSPLRDGYAAGGALRAGAAIPLTASVHFLFDGALSARFVGDRTPAHRARAGLNWSATPDVSLRAEGMIRGKYREAALNAVLYR